MLNRLRDSSFCAPFLRNYSTEIIAISHITRHSIFVVDLKCIDLQEKFRIVRFISDVRIYSNAVFSLLYK